MSFGKRLKLLRENKGLTQKELAENLNINRSRLSLYELDEREPDQQLTIQIAAYFGVSTDYLLGNKISANDPSREIAELLKNNGIEKARMVKELSIEEVKMGVALIKAMQKEKTGD